MVKVLLYGYCLGVTSSRRLARHLQEDIGFRVLAANQTPDFRHALRISQAASGGPG